MIREFHLADWVTLGNAVCGTGALFSMMTYLQTGDVMHVYFACGLVLVALILDCLLYTSDAADERSSADLGGRRTRKKKKEKVATPPRADGGGAS